MIKPIRMLEPAKEEFFEAIKYYNSQISGLGFEFKDDVLKSIEKIRNYPFSWSSIQGNLVRKCRCSRFPYNVIYYQTENTIIIVAIMHLRRKPNYWKERIK